MNSGRRNHNTKPEVPVTIAAREEEPVADGAAHEPRKVEEGTATHHTRYVTFKGVI